MKYNLDDLHWQEFETLAFRVMQILVAPSVQYLESGADGGRDLIYNGTSGFDPAYEGEWIFQVKHKSKSLSNKQVAEVLASDLKSELTKVFITKEQKFDVYILITNKEITADLFDRLVTTFAAFKKKHSINCAHFSVIGYRHFESSIDGSDRLKWSYPNIVSHPDFERLIQEATLKHLDNRQKGWLKTVERQKERFVFTRFFSSASEKLNELPAVILSGPPKSGKTFNAEILALNYFLYRGFEPVVVDTLEDMEGALRPKKSQIFIFDDAFGKYSMSYESRDWFGRLTFLFSLADKDHLFVFTSREYIFREWVNLGNENIREFLNKILVESHSYITEEKLAMLDRYTQLSGLSEWDKTSISTWENDIVAHRNFSPETIRAFFANLIGVKAGDAVKALMAHLEQPDSYLGQVFRSLATQKQAAVIALLCCVKNGINALKKTFGVVCKDLAINAVLNAEVEFDELDDSIIRIARTDFGEVVRFYHPSMSEFLIRQIVGRDAVVLKDVIFKNVNSDILALSQLSADGPKITNVGLRDVQLEEGDLAALEVGFSRLVLNADSSLFQVTEAMGWFTLSQHTVDLKMNSHAFFDKVQMLLSIFVHLVFSGEFFWIHRTNSCQAWGAFLRAISRSAKLFHVEKAGMDLSSLSKLLREKSGEQSYWVLVLRSLDFVDDGTVRTILGRDWLNQFYSELKSDIDELGREVYGEDYPDFRQYEHQTKVLKKLSEKMKAKPNRSWYPRFLKVEERVDVLKEVRGQPISNAILERITTRYDSVKGLKDYAKNRHRFIVNRGWWSDNQEEDDK